MGKLHEFDGAEKGRGAEGFGEGAVGVGIFAYFFEYAVADEDTQNTN